MQNVLFEKAIDINLFNKVALDIYIPLLLKWSFEIRLKEEENTIIDVTLVCVSLVIKTDITHKE
jgi:hypothetical protein